jgi:hypothetical protein
MPLQFTSPNPELLQELQEVAIDAQALLAAVRASNSLPEDFPDSQLCDIASSLCELPLGTAEGCRAPLEYARARLPAIRREHILSNSPYGPSQSPDAPPPALRGEDLDQKLRNLISSVTTALDEYRRQATEPTDETIEERAFPNPDTPAVHTAIDEASIVHEEMRKAREQISQHAAAGAGRTDTLVRNISDAQNLSRLVRAELLMREVVARWHRGISQAIQKAPSLIRAAGTAIEVSVDVVEPYAHWWDNLWSDIESRALHHLRALGTATRKVADDLEQRQAPDAMLKGSVEDDYWPPQRIKDYFIEKRSIPTHVANEVIELAFGNMSRKLKVLDGLSQFPKLQSLGLARTNVPDLKPLSSLKNLRHIDLSSANIRTLPTLPIIPMLQSIVVRQCGLESLDFLANQPNLRRIIADFGQIRDISAVATIPLLEDIDLEDSELADASPLVNVKNLQSLNISRTNISSLEPLGQIPTLVTLKANVLPISDLGPLSKLPKLTHLEISDTQIKDISPLVGIKTLRTLDLRNTAVEDISALASIVPLYMVRVSAKKVKGIEALVNTGVHVQQAD